MKKALLTTAIILLLAVGGAGTWLYTPDKSRAALEATYLADSDRYIDAAGIRLRVRDTGPRDAPAVIMLHGFGASLLTWEPWAKRLSDGFRVIRIDLPGSGLTGPDPTGDYSDARFMKILSALMDQLGVAKASLIGNSIGGRLAWKFAAENPARVDRLVLVSPDGFASPGFDYGKPPEIGPLVRALPYILPRALLRMSIAPAYGNPAALTEARVTAYRDMMLVPGVRQAMVRRMQQAILEPPEPILRGIQAPTLLVWGGKDQMIPFANATDYLKTLPHAELVSFPDLGHVPQEEAPDQSLPPVRAFLTRTG